MSFLQPINGSEKDGLCMHMCVHLINGVLRGSALWRTCTGDKGNAHDFPTSNRDQNVREHHTIIYIYITNFIMRKRRKVIASNLYQQQCFLMWTCDWILWPFANNRENYVTNISNHLEIILKFPEEITSLGYFWRCMK